MSKAASKRTRPWEASPELNALEHAWWESNGALMSRLWDYDPALNRAARGGYLDRAREFLSAGKPASIVELGCGSGWPGRLLAGPDVTVTGVDFSQAQVDAAARAAREEGAEERCRYVRADSIAQPGVLERADGVIIHAFLHHLDGKELQTALDALKAGLRPGARIWIYEPAFHDTPPDAPAALEPDVAVRLEAAERMHGALKNWLLEKGLVDRPRYDAFLEKWAESERNGWYLSPKEVPLCIGEFTAELSSRFRVTGARWATVRMIAWLFEINLVTDPSLRSWLVDSFVPLLADADRMLAGQEAWLRAAMVRPEHAFYVWECVA